MTLSVPVELDNMFQDKIGYLDWEFMIEEYPVEPDDPKPPLTGDDSNPMVWVAVAAGAVALLLILLFIWRKKEREDDETPVKR